MHKGEVAKGNPPRITTEPMGISLKTWGNLFFFVENTVELLKKNYICTIHY